jgi:hypothetical protein
MVKFIFGTNVSGESRKRMMHIVLGEDSSASDSLFSQLEWKNQHGFFYCYPFSMIKRIKASIAIRPSKPALFYRPGVYARATWQLVY